MISAATNPQQQCELRHVKQSRFTPGTLFVDYQPGWRFKLAANAADADRARRICCVFLSASVSADTSVIAQGSSLTFALLASSAADCDGAPPNLKLHSKF